MSDSVVASSLRDIFKKEIDAFYNEGYDLCYPDLMDLGVLVIDTLKCWQYKEWMKLMKYFLSDYFQYDEHLEAVLNDIWGGRSTKWYCGFGKEEKSCSVYNNGFQRYYVPLVANFAYEKAPLYAKIFGHKYFHNIVVLPAFVLMFLAVLLVLCFIVNLGSIDFVLKSLPIATITCFTVITLYLYFKKSGYLIVIPWLCLIVLLLVILTFREQFPFNSFTISVKEPLLLSFTIYAVLNHIYLVIIQKWGFNYIQSRWGFSESIRLTK